MGTIHSNWLPNSILVILVNYLRTYVVYIEV